MKLFSEIGIKAITSIKDKVCSASNENNEPSKDFGPFLNLNKLHILIEKFGLKTLSITSSDILLHSFITLLNGIFEILLEWGNIRLFIDNSSLLSKYFSPFFSLIQRYKGCQPSGTIYPPQFEPVLTL